jgi:excisionase family DNA binding protein
MTLSINQKVKQLALTSEDANIAKVSSQILASYSQKNLSYGVFKLISDDTEDETVTIPVAALNLLTEILTQMAAGNAVSVVSMKQELTTQEAADILQVSRPYLVELLESGEIPYRKVGSRRRVLTADVINYKNRIDTARMETLAELSAQAQELNMGY